MASWSSKVTYRPLHAVKNRHIIAGSFTSPNVNNMMRSASCALLLNLIYSTGFAFHVPLTVQRKSLPKSCSSGVGSVPSNPNCRGSIVLYEAESPDDESEEEAEIVVPPSEDEEEEGGGEELIAKDLLLTAYRNSKYLYGVATVLTLATVTGPVARTTKIGCATGFAVAARVASILEEATTHDRLQSDTYKCLNVGLHFYNLIGLAAVPAEAALFPNKISVSLALGVFSVVKLFGGYASLNGWKAGVGPGKLLRRELVTGFNDSMKITRTNNRKTSRGRAYRNLVYVLMAGVNIQMVKAFLSVIQRVPFTEGGLYVSSAMRLTMLSTMAFCLKSAYNRDRLTGTTFMQLTEAFFWWFLAGIQPGGEFLLKKGKMLLMVPPLAIEILRVRRKKAAESTE